MICKRCGRVLTLKQSQDDEMGAVCKRKMQAAKSRYKPTELFDLTEYPAEYVKASCERIQEARQIVFVYQIPIPLNFNPVINTEMSMAEQHRKVCQVIFKRGSD